MLSWKIEEVMDVNIKNRSNRNVALASSYKIGRSEEVGTSSPVLRRLGRSE